MFDIPPSVLKDLKERYKKGTRVKLLNMEDETSVPSGTLGTVLCVDDIGTVHVKWDNGSSLGLVPGTDSFCVIND